MAEPTIEDLTAKVEAMISKFAVYVGSADYQEQNEIINGVMDSTTALYLRLSLTTGEIEPGVIWPDFNKRIVNLACFKFALVPLVAYWSALVEELVKAKAAFLIMSDQDVSDLDNMQLRLAKYESALDAAGTSTEPSEMLWLRVGAPLLLGYYPADFADAGIINPAAKSKPDITTPFTLFSLGLIHGEARRQLVLQIGEDLKSGVGDALLWVLNLPSKTIEGVIEAGKAAGTALRKGTTKLLIGAGIGLAALFYFSRSR